MAARRNNDVEKEPVRRRPATTPEGRENQLIALAIDLAEKQLADGTASAQVISHYIKLGSSRERLEQERLMRENEVLREKAEALASAKNVEALYKDALDAMRGYQGHGRLDTGDDYDDD